ncbi:MAG: UDP-2,3-diacylglucosamine diphosphatase [Thermodesulfobacteriota bacterium]
MRAVFVGDAHLKGRNDPNQKRLCSFLNTLEGIDRLFILGDLFEFWVGYNSVIYHHYAPVVNGLINLRRSGVSLLYTEGNHDFFLKRFFSGRVGVDIYPNTADIQFDGKRVLLAHGDLADRRGSYMFMRRFLRSPLFRLIHRLAPPAFSWEVAMSLSKKSRNAMERGGLIEKFMKEYARKKIGEGFDLTVMGHTHIAAISHETVNGREGTYANPGDWIEDHTYLVYEDGQLRIEQFGS